MATMSTVGTQARGGHSRSFGGCENCRRRHLKCDETKPCCLVCERDGRTCAGYGKNIFFWPDDRAVADRIRRQLFSESEQRVMSELLLASAPQEDTSRLLQEIDTQCDSVSATTSSSFQIARGPFGALRFTIPHDSPDILPLPVIWGTEDENANKEISVTDFLNWTTEEQQEPVQLDETALDLDPQDLPSPLLELDPVFMDFNTSVDQWSESTVDQLVRDDQFSLGAADPVLPISLSPNPPSTKVPQDAPFLLNYYVDFVIASLTPVKGDKSPWHTLFFTHAKQTLATLILGKHPDHASLSIFYAILSVSAFRFRTSSMSQIWNAQAHRYKSMALKSLQASICDASSVPKKVKYKSILMALLTMIQVSVFSDALNQAEYYLLDAEKFIRLRGLTKQTKSRRVRSLHHCYSYPRLFYESTFVLSAENSQREQVLRAVERGGPKLSVQDSPTFKLANWSKLDENMVEIKSKESGENDLHLERPGIWSATLYPDIYGVPEPFLVLLSQTIRLANEKDSAEQEEPGANLSWKDFWARANSLERCIVELQQHSLDDIGWVSHRVTETVPGNDQSVHRNLLEALNQALSIYFYRRIFNLDPSLLQSKVSLVRDRVLHCDHLHSDLVRYSTGFTWPAFIAASEATDPALQASFSMWFKRCADDTGLPTFRTMLRVTELIWAGRRDGTLKGSWPEVLRSNNVRLFFP